MHQQRKFMPAKQMHGYVITMFGLFVLFTISLQFACMRVSQDKKFTKYNFHLKSLTVEYKPEKPSL
jgi:hypothetical protein